MNTLTIQLPDSVDVEKSDVLRMIASRLYERGTLSLGQSAKLAGMRKWDFAEVLGDYGVPVFNYPSSDLGEDFRNA